MDWEESKINNIMNKYLSALATTLITFTICGQTNSNYVPLVREGVEWTFTVSYENSFGFNYMRNVTEHFSGDTTVNGVTYKKLYRHEPENPYSSATPVAGMREANGAVHVIYFGNVPLHNGIDATVNQDKTVAKIEYVGPAGVVCSTPVPGINIVITRYTDGSRSIGKQLH